MAMTTGATLSLSRKCAHIEWPSVLEGRMPSVSLLEMNNRCWEVSWSAQALEATSVVELGSHASPPTSRWCSYHLVTVVLYRKQGTRRVKERDWHSFGEVPRGDHCCWSADHTLSGVASLTLIYMWLPQARRHCKRNLADSTLTRATKLAYEEADRPSPPPEWFSGSVQHTCSRA